MEETTTRVGDGWGDNSAPQVNTDDESRRRKVTVEGREWVLQARDPFGMWYVMIPGGGAPPVALSGAYTGLWEAEAAIKQYMSQNPVSPAKREAVEKGTKPPELKTKPVKAVKEVTDG